MIVQPIASFGRMVLGLCPNCLWHCWHRFGIIVGPCLTRSTSSSPTYGELREQRDLSQERLSHNADLNTTHVEKTERSEREPGVRTIAKPAVALEVPQPNCSTASARAVPGGTGLTGKSKTRDGRAISFSRGDAGEDCVARPRWGALPSMPRSPARSGGASYRGLLSVFEDEGTPMTFENLFAGLVTEAQLGVR